MLNAGQLRRLIDILNNYSDLIRGPQQKQKFLEIEAKFTDGNRSDVPHSHYERLLNYLISSPDVQLETSEESHVEILGSTRRITITPKGNQRETVIWQEKKSVGNIDLIPYNIKISVNTEEFLDQFPAIFEPEVIRNRSRRSFIMKNNLIQIDMTKVMMHETQRTKKAKKTGCSKMDDRYEVEVEYLGNQDNLIIFNDFLSKIFRILRGTHLVYTNDMKNSLIRSFVTDKDSLVKARNIKYHDLVYGGIVGNKKIISGQLPIENRINGSEGTNYMITYKVDGLRKLLIIDSSGIWLVYPPFEYNLVIPNRNKIFSDFEGTIFDGELAKSKVANDFPYWYLPFDCLAFRSMKSKKYSNVQDQAYTKRLAIMKSIINNLPRSNILGLSIKRTEEIDSPERFFALVNDFLDKRDDQEFYEDGLMFIPINTVYNPRSEEYSHKERKLTQIPDICKWKDNITIDFSLKWVDGGNLQLCSYDRNKGEMVPFRGTKEFPLTQDMIDSESPWTKNKDSGLVVEYEWVNLSDGTGILRPAENFNHKPGNKDGPIRYDKHGPNPLSTATDNWKDIKKPITEEDIRGKNISLLRRYHNRIKTELYESLIQDPIYILDIGSGKGGDIDKWRKLKNVRIVAVEPDIDNREELRRRLIERNFTQQVEVVETNGEDTISITQSVEKFIPGGKVDVVTLMLSMSFFWKSELHLNSLVNTIVTNLKPGGKILFLTIDGTTLEDIFEKGNISDMKLADVDIHLYPNVPFGREVDFNIPDTIVGNQREYIVHISDFTRKLENYGIHLYEEHKADKEKLLTEDNLLLSSMYTYGYYVNDDKERLIEKRINTMSEFIPVSTNNISEFIPVSTNNVSEFIPVSINNMSESNPYKIRDNILNSLSVNATYQRGNGIINGPAINDDTYAPLKCSWYNDVVRIATIGDGSCFIHSALKGFYPPYQENNNARYRINLTREIRRDLAVSLGTPDPKHPNYIYWETANRGQFQNLLMQEIISEILDEIDYNTKGFPLGNNLLNTLRVDYSLNGLMYLFNSESYLGDEVFDFVANIFNIDIYIVLATPSDIKPIRYSQLPGVQRNAIVITGNTYHYETVAIDTNEGLQTVFGPEDPFLLALQKLFIEGGSKQEFVEFDPDENFIENFITNFTVDGKFLINEAEVKIDQIFPPDREDPFSLTFHRLKDQIIERFQYFQGISDDPIIIKMDLIITVLREAGFSIERTEEIRASVTSRRNPDTYQDLDTILAEAEADGELDQDTINAIISAEAVL